MKKEKNRLGLILILIFLLLTITISLTYAVFVYSKAGQRRNIISTGTLVFTYTETTNGIFLNNAMPTTDEVGKMSTNENGNNGFFDFSVKYSSPKSRTINYEIYACEEDTNTLDPRFVKIYLTDQNNLAIGGYEKPVLYADLPTSMTNSACKRLYYGTFQASGVRDFRLRMWLSDKYEVTELSRLFKIKVNTSAVEG